MADSAQMTLDKVYAHREGLGPNNMIELREKCKGHSLQDAEFSPAWKHKPPYFASPGETIRFCTVCFFVTVDPPESHRGGRWFQFYGAGWTSRHESRVEQDASPEPDESVKTLQGGRPDSSRRRH
jgi:hypothetical protein